MAGSGNVSLHHLIESIYGSVEEPARWEQFLESFAAALGTRRAHFWISRIDQRRPMLAANFGSSEAIAALIETPGYRDPWMSRIDLATVPVGQILRSNEICADEVVVTDEFYQRLQLIQDDHYGGGVMLERSNVASSGMSTIRSRSAGPLTDEEMAVWRALIPHLQTAVRLVARSARTSAERETR